MLKVTPADDLNRTFTLTQLTVWRFSFPTPLNSSFLKKFWQINLSTVINADFALIQTCETKSMLHVGKALSKMRRT